MTFLSKIEGILDYNLSNLKYECIFSNTLILIQNKKKFLHSNAETGQ